MYNFKIKMYQKLRNTYTIGQNIIDSLFLMNVEKSIFNKINSEEVINILETKTSFFDEMLLF